MPCFVFVQKIVHPGLVLNFVSNRTGAVTSKNFGVNRVPSEIPRNILSNCLTSSSRTALLEFIMPLFNEIFFTMKIHLHILTHA